MNVLIVGGGLQAAPCAAILTRQAGVRRVLLGSRSLASCLSVLDHLGDPRFSAAEFDARNPDSIVAAVRGYLQTVDVIIDLTPAYVSWGPLEAALALGAHYVNTAAASEHLAQLIDGEPLALADRFVTANRTALLGCGATPGLVNIICRRFCDRLDSVERIEIRYGAHTPAQTAIIKAWVPTFSPEQLYIDYCDPPCVFRSGRHQKLAPFSEPETYDFGGNLGKVQLAHHDHEEVYSLPLKIGKGLQYCCFKYPIEPAVATLIATGFTLDRVVEVQGATLKAVDVLMQLVPRLPKSELLDPHAQRHFIPFISDIRAHILIKGTAAGKDRMFQIMSGLYCDQAAKAFELFGTANIPVAYAAVTGALQLMEGKTKPGIVWPEELDPVRFFELANTMGLEMKVSTTGVSAAEVRSSVMA